MRQICLTTIVRTMDQDMFDELQNMEEELGVAVPDSSSSSSRKRSRQDRDAQQGAGDKGSAGTASSSASPAAVSSE